MRQRRLFATPLRQNWQPPSIIDRTPCRENVRNVWWIRQGEGGEVAVRHFWKALLPCSLLARCTHTRRSRRNKFYAFLPKHRRPWILRYLRVTVCRCKTSYEPNWRFFVPFDLFFFVLFCFFCNWQIWIRSIKKSLPLLARIRKTTISQASKQTFRIVSRGGKPRLLRNASLYTAGLS